MKVCIVILFFSTFLCNGQNTLSFSENGTSPKASLQDVAWMEGHWKGEAFGGVTEEIWSPPLGGSMMFVFKLVSDGKVNFYEVGHIQQTGETLVLQLKHFHGNLKGWEEKDDTVDFKLVKVEGDRVFFDGFTFEKISDDEVNLYVVISQDNKTEKEVKFNYKRM
ncbi:DUF6265 family protein [Ulvibacterium marinum]|uniref:DUF6265 domain-containing protein n=1 Tax=Ulvibacterium marinum TaxID=2419782 RepID=A0A3B0CBW6_9FLAO|nr:DUF6265 family protein [Ulvibacterium marinum]RKN82430.1 hypothetical protein D7Z94_00825 [Ulvibacterium marinum]